VKCISNIQLLWKPQQIKYRVKRLGSLCKQNTLLTARGFRREIFQFHCVTVEECSASYKRSLSLWGFSPPNSETLLLMIVYNSRGLAGHWADEVVMGWEGIGGGGVYRNCGSVKLNQYYPQPSIMVDRTETLGGFSPKGSGRHARARAYTHIRTCAHSHAITYRHKQIHMYVYTITVIYCTHTHTHTHTRAHTHTHTHTHKDSY
jgi:hypothetical protein